MSENPRDQDERTTSGPVERWWERNTSSMRYYTDVTDTVTLCHQVESAFGDPRERLDALLLAREELRLSTSADARLAQEITELAQSLQQRPFPAGPVSRG